MSELDDAIARLGEAIARLEAASLRAQDRDGERAAAIAAIAEKIDAALARLAPLIDREE